jgi:hypothetical protein
MALAPRLPNSKEVRKLLGVGMQSIKLSRWLSALALLVFALSWGEAALSAQQKRDGAPATQRQQHQDTTNQQQTDATGQLPDLAIFGGKIVKSDEGKSVRVAGTVDAR